MRGLRYQRARNALLELEKLGEVRHTKNWRPQVRRLACHPPAAHRCSLHRTQWPAPLHTVAGSVACGCSRHHPRLQVLLFCKCGYDGMVSQPGLLTFVNQLKGARGVTIISTAVPGDLTRSAGTQMRIERTLRRQRDEQGIHGFTQAVPRRGVGPPVCSV